MIHGLVVSVSGAGGEASSEAAAILDFQHNDYALDGVDYRDPISVPGLTYTRTGDATAWRSDGTLQEFAPNEPRITDLGIMIENQRTNLDPWSRNNPGWTGNGTTPPTTQADITEDGRRCVSVTFPAGSDVGYGGCRAEISSVINRATIQAGNTYTWSAEIKLSRQLVSGESLSIYYTGAAGLGVIPVNQSNQKAGWHRISKFETSGSSGSVGFVPYVSGAILSPLTLFITNRQLETGTYATTPIITTGAAATVGADNLALVLPAGVTAYRADYNGNQVAQGAAAPGPFDLASAGRPWIGGSLQRITFS